MLFHISHFLFDLAEIENSVKFIRQDMEDYVWDFYQTTVKMSSYLVGMMVSEFAGTQSESELNRVPFTIWTRPSLTKLTKYS